MKTVLAPNAPWPGRIKPAPKPATKAAPTKRVHKRKDGSKQSQVDARFEEWMAKL
jgi:hypothetical protein